MTTTIQEIPVLDATPDNGTVYHIPHFVDRFEGVLETRQDEDWIRIELNAGHAVTITLTGHGDAPVIDTLLIVSAIKPTISSHKCPTSDQMCRKRQVNRLDSCIRRNDE